MVNTLAYSPWRSIRHNSIEGVCVTDYKVTKFENAFDSYAIHSFKFIPLEGGESTVKIKLPIVQEDGSFMAGGVQSKMRMQRIDQN